MQTLNALGRYAVNLSFDVLSRFKTESRIAGGTLAGIGTVRRFSERHADLSTVDFHAIALDPLKFFKPYLDDIDFEPAACALPVIQTGVVRLWLTSLGLFSGEHDSLFGRRDIERLTKATFADMLAAFEALSGDLTRELPHFPNPYVLTRHQLLLALALRCVEYRSARGV